MILKIKKLNIDARIPFFAKEQDAGMDLFASEKTVLKSGETVKIKTGISMEIENGFVGLIWDKSGIGAKGLKTLCGVIDSGYRGEILIVMKNLNSEDYTFEKGDKVAQMLIQEINRPEIVEVSELSNTERGDSGFGSSGY